MVTRPWSGALPWPAPAQPAGPGGVAPAVGVGPGGTGAGSPPRVASTAAPPATSTTRAPASAARERAGALLNTRKGDVTVSILGYARPVREEGERALTSGTPPTSSER